MTPLVWIVVAFVTAIVVMVVAGSATGARPGVRQFVTDLRDGVRRSPDAGGIRLLADTRRELHAMAETGDDGGVADIFRLGQPADRAYVDAGELTAPLARVTRRTLRTVVGRIRA